MSEPSEFVMKLIARRMQSTPGIDVQEWVKGAKGIEIYSLRRGFFLL